KNELATAIQVRDGLKARGLGPEFTQMQAAEQDIETARRSLVAARTAVIETAKNDYRSAAANEQNLQTQVSQAQAATLHLDRKNVTYSKLAADLKAERDVQTTMLQQQKELNVISSSRLNNVLIMD